MEELVSIITASYNTANYISETIETVLAQTYTNWEMIIVDDCSIDNTNEVVQRYTDERIRYFKMKSNSGAAVARNFALQKARGRWIAFLDSDDLWNSSKLEKQINFMKNNGYHFSYTCYEEIDEFGKENGITVTGPAHITKLAMYAYCWPGCLTVMYDSEFIGKLQIAEIRKNNDYAMWLKVIQKADCYLLPEILAKYRRGRRGSISTHGYVTLIKWHYLLWHENIGMSFPVAILWTGINVLFGVWKKYNYIKRKNVFNRY